MMITKIDHKILPQLQQALIDNCPTLKEAHKRVKEAFLKSAYPELTEKFDLVPRIFVTNLYHLDNEKPVFELRSFDFYLDHYEFPIFNKDEKAKKKRATANRIFNAIKDTIEDEGKLPIVIETPGPIVILKDCLDADIVFGLPREVEDIKQKLTKPFKNARTIG